MPKVTVSIGFHYSVMRLSSVIFGIALNELSNHASLISIWFKTFLSFRKRIYFFKITILSEKVTAKIALGSKMFLFLCLHSCI